MPQKKLRKKPSYFRQSINNNHVVGCNFVQIMDVQTSGLAVDYGVRWTSFADFLENLLKFARATISDASTQISGRVKSFSGETELAAQPSLLKFRECNRFQQKMRRRRRSLSAHFVLAEFRTKRAFFEKVFVTSSSEEIDSIDF